MSLRYPFAIVKPGLNVLTAPTPTYTYYIYGAGRNSSGQIGDGTASYRSSPTQVGSASTWTSVFNAEKTSIGVQSDGTLWTWGSNSAGQLGNDKATGNVSSPIQIGALTNWSQSWTQIGGQRTGSVCCIKTDGTLWIWGDNGSGQLGDGTANARSSPIQVGSDTTWAQVSMGDSSTRAIKTDGTLWVWGSGQDGQLGLGNVTSYSSPKQVGSLTNWLFVSAGMYCTFAIKTNGTLWSWGRNNFGQLGLGNTTYYSSPKQVGALTTWSRVQGGYGMTLALKTDGTMWAWGRNDDGNLGLGNAVAYSSPKQIGALTTWSKIACSTTTCWAVKTDGTAWSWGQDAAGLLMQNTTFISRSSPTQIGSATNWANFGICYYAYTPLALRY